MGETLREVHGRVRVTNRPNGEGGYTTEVCSSAYAADPETLRIAYATNARMGETIGAVSVHALSDRDREVIRLYGLPRRELEDRSR